MGRTVGDEGPAGEHLAQHELDHGQDDAGQAADDGHTEQEAVLRGQEGETAQADSDVTEGWEWRSQYVSQRQ